MESKSITKQFHSYLWAFILVALSACMGNVVDGLEDGVRGNADGVVAVEVGDDTDGGAADDDAGSDDGLAVCVLDGSRDFVLGEREGAADEDQQARDRHSEMVLHLVGNLVKQNGMVSVC